MKWFLIVLITAGNAENVKQIGPFDTEAACKAAEEFVEHYEMQTKCFYNGYGQEQEKIWQK